MALFNLRVLVPASLLVLAAILGNHYGHELNEGRFRIALDNDCFLVRYGEHQLPLDPCTYGLVLAKATEGRSEDDVGRYLASAFGTLHDRTLPPEQRRLDVRVLSCIRRRSSSC